MDHDREPGHHREDIRMKATSTIWQYATGMMVFSIPLAAITNSALVPLAVICGSALSTGVVWLFAGKQEPAAPLPRRSVSPQQLQELEERLDNLETISRFEERLSQGPLVTSSRHEPLPAETTYGRAPVGIER